MRCSEVLLAVLAVLPQAICQASLSSTSVVTCITTLGTTSVVSIPTNSNLRSLTIDSIQPSTLTPTATSTPPDITTTLTSTLFPTTTTTLANSEIDTFSTTTTLVSALLITDTVTTTTTTTVSKTITTTPTSTIPAYSNSLGTFVPAASGQALFLEEYYASEYPNKKRSSGRRSPKKGSYGGAIGARQLSAAASASATVSPSEYLIPNAVSCSGIVEYFSVTTKIVSTAPAVTTTLVPITDTTSTTVTTTITSSVLSAPASTTETISTTITTTSLAGTSTSTVYQTSTTTITAQAAQVTTYGACQENNLVDTIKDANYPINVISELALAVEFKEVVVTSAASAYACCVQGVTGTYVGNGYGVAYNPNTDQCYIFLNELGAASCNPESPQQGYDYCSKNPSVQYTVSSGDCGYPVPVNQCTQ
ncbi:MAG: hypothetical protein ALECFALPRED_001327 [Alectoria fallacina]|uniref:Uncharacterized protein n=1 Tax=Alectoria fallacina TaxID=1903189 RepID=A0A8H3F5S4_9LECA|nr:MAG: hypothetical protein ALECFALPRED_001327 [Alectoria fallacina]